MARSPLVFERILPAPPEVVFHHWSDPASLSVWMRPEPSMDAAKVEVDFRVGGRFRIVMSGEQEYVQHGEYLEIDPGKRIVFSWISEWMPPGEQETLVSVSLSPVGDEETRLLLVHESLPDSDSYDGHEGGWNHILDVFTAHLHPGQEVEQ